MFILLDEIKVSLRLKDFGSHIGHDREEITLHQFVIAKCHFESEAKSQGIDARNNLRQMKNKGRMTWLKKYDSRRELELRKSARREAIARDEFRPVQFVQSVQFVFDINFGRRLGEPNQRVLDALQGPLMVGDLKLFPFGLEGLVGIRRHLHRGPSHLIRHHLRLIGGVILTCGRMRM